MQQLHTMDTTVTLHAPALCVADEVALAAEVAATFAAAERRFSRFRDDSELSRLNRAVGATPVSPAMLAALVRARAYVLLTGGRFDPAIGGALQAAGYDRSFASGVLDQLAVGAARPAPARFADVELDLASGHVTRPPHLQLDLGGMIKGATVDRAAMALPATAALDAGGDMALRGAGPDGDGWVIDVEDPGAPAHVLISLRVCDGAVATSAASRRRWRRGSDWAHNIIDPALGAPAVTDLAQVTVIADTVERAEVLSKAVFIAGRRAGRELLDSAGVAGAVLVTRNGEVELVGDLERDDGS